VAAHAGSDLATAAEIADVAAAARDRGRLGIDTEFMSEGRYRALLCLTQVVVDRDNGEPLIIVIDALDGADTTPLAEVLADPSIEIVLHAGRQDVAILRRVLAHRAQHIFDTQIAAGFAGASAQAGYANLLGAILGRRVNKTASYTGGCPASHRRAAQLRGEDVAHLLELADELQGRLRDSGRLGWAVEECRRLESATDERDPETAWERLPRVNQLDPRPALWRVSSPPGASEPRSPRPAGRLRCWPIRRWWSWPSASRRTCAASSRSRASHPSGLRRAGRRSSRRSQQAARRRRSRASRRASALSPATPR